MRVPLSWLTDFTPLAIDATDPEALRGLGRSLDELGLVVESIEPVAAGLDGVVLARVLELAPIAGADKIRRVLVDAGGPDPVEIVCGAWNFAVGDVVPLATVGTTLPNGLTIAQRKMRGATSNGMLCSAPELGLPGEGSGLLVLAAPGPDGALPAGVTPGMALAEHLGLVPDAVFDLAIEPNRPDCLSMAGVARDLAAHLRLPFSLPEFSLPEGPEPAGELARVATEAPAACDRIVGRVLTGLVPLASPPLVARRLLLAGMRPISAVVDASNYVMLELGQPTHPYDLDRLAGGAIVARLARAGERLVTLDGSERRLGVSGVDECVIADGADGVVGLAGVMGGATSEVSAATTRVLLESAHFDARTVGRAAKRQGLRTEASARFERGVDPAGAGRAADRVCALVRQAAAHAGAPAPRVAAGRLEDAPVPLAPLRLVLRTARLNALLGTALAAADAAALLEPIGFATMPAGDDLAVEVPSFRPDVTREVDLVEEVARHHGYEAIPATMRRSPAVGRLSGRQQALRALRRLLAGTGALEAWTPSIVDPAAEHWVAAGVAPVALANPIVAEESVLRTGLLPGLLAALRHNVRHRNPAVRFFEIGAVFAAGQESEWPAESEQLGVLLAGEGDDAASAVACWRRIVSGLRLSDSAVDIVQGDALAADASPLLAGLHPTRRALLVGPAGPLGALGELDPAALDAAEVAGRRVGWLVVELAALLDLPRASLLARPVSRYPSSDVDLAFVLPEEVPAGALERALVAAAGERCEWVRLLDVYRGAPLAAGTRSLAYRLRFVAQDHTLTDAEIAELRRRCIEAAEAALPARLRA